ncbi:unnamed protein product [Tetraodon nigroviridis]|uniref:(spotted green pufferfish) hypothetical protein n=1 Tax=Tetraodon nigroviridis TaxID=99883 RepID=Q4SE87_TETNG|nr:unnamed protein product [Tetraodon nigroviridis]
MAALGSAAGLPVGPTRPHLPDQAVPETPQLRPGRAERVPRGRRVRQPELGAGGRRVSPLRDAAVQVPVPGQPGPAGRPHRTPSVQGPPGPAAPAARGAALGGQQLAGAGEGCTCSPGTPGCRRASDGTADVFLQVASCEDHLGFQRLSQVLAQVDGSVLPLVSLLDLCSSHQNLALRSSIGYLLCPDAVHRLAFPVLTGTLEWNQGAPGQRCHVLLEPLCRGQKLLPESVRVRLTAVLQDWDSSALRQPASECWVLHRSGCSAPGAEAFRHLLTELSARRLHLARLLLTHQTSPAATGSTHLPRVVGGLLGVVCDLMEHSDTTDEPPSDPPVPEWAQQEVRLHPLGGGVLESWFPLSDQAGVSSHLMESMR